MSNNNFLITGTIIKKTLKTIKIMLIQKKRHVRYQKIINTIRIYTAHDPHSKGEVGNIVIIAPSKPYSKTKRWILREVI